MIDYLEQATYSVGSGARSLSSESVSIQGDEHIAGQRFGHHHPHRTSSKYARYLRPRTLAVRWVRKKIADVAVRQMSASSRINPSWDRAAPKPMAFLPIMTKARELDGRLLLAAFLAKRGCRVLLGSGGTVHKAASHTKRGLYLSPSLAPYDANRLQMLRNAGHAIIAWHEEGLVYPDPAWYFANRVGVQTANSFDAILAWGSVSAADLASALPSIRVPILPLGNPRIDVLRRPYRNMHQPAVAQLRAQFGKYVLVNTNFDLVNHVDGPDWPFRRMREIGRIAGAKDEERFAKWAAYRRATFDAFRAGIPQLRARLPDVHIVIRPHPSENLAPWRMIAAGLQRVSVEPPTQTVVPWILGAEMVVHNSCTTAVEAFLLDTPVVAFHVPEIDTEMESRLPNTLSRPAYSWDEVADLLSDVMIRGREGWFTDEQRAIADEFVTARTGDFACERIVALAEKLGTITERGTLPDPVSLGIKPRSIIRRAASALRRAAGLSLLDSRLRFGKLRPDDVVGPLGAIGSIMGHDLRCYAYGPDACVVETSA